MSTDRGRGVEQGSPAPERRPGRIGLKGAFGVLLMVAIALATLYERAYILRDLERSVRDFQARLRAPWESDAVRIVRITDEDYRDLFQGRSPLAPEPLRRLISAIARGDPTVIAVDIDTSDPAFRSFAAEEGWPPVVWARALECSGEASLDCPEQGRTLLDFAGSASPGGGALHGVVTLQTDPQGLIRRYRRWIGAGDTVHPALATAIRAAAGMGVDTARDDRDFFIHYRPWPPGALHDASSVIEASGQPGFGETGFLKDRIVVLGGDYRAARDRYATPLGEMPGVVILSQTLLTEMEGRLTRPLSPGVLGAALLLNGLALLGLFQVVSFQRAFLAALLSIPVLAGVTSLAVEGELFTLWPYLVPLLVAVLVQQVYTHAIYYRDQLIGRATEKIPRPRHASPGATDGEGDGEVAR
jgi:CHASE2 domain-containing sensor protein